MLKPRNYISEQQRVKMGCQLQNKLGRMGRIVNTNKNTGLGNGEDRGQNGKRDRRRAARGLVQNRQLNVFPHLYKRIKDEIGRKSYFEWKNAKESERKIWTRARYGNIYNLVRYKKHSKKREEKESKKENIWRGLEDQLRKGSMELEIMEFLKQEEKNTKPKNKRCIEKN